MPGLHASLDAVLSEMTDDDVLVALPSLRLAFSFFSPLEKEAFARGLLALRGGDASAARSLLQLAAAPGIIARARVIEAEVSRVAQRFGLADPEDA